MDTVSSTNIDWKSLDAGKYRLTAYVHPQFLGYAVVGKDNGTLLHIEGEYLPEKAPQPDLPIRKWLQTYHALLNVPFGEVHIGVYSQRFTLLPDIDLQSELAMAQLCGFDTNTELLFSDKLDQQVNLHFAVPQSVTQLLSDHFSRKTICFGEAGWLRSVLGYQASTVCVHLIGSDLLIAVVEDHEIKYLNRFEAHNQEEILYYILLVYNLLGYDTNSVSLEMHGFIEKVSPIYQLLYGYIAHIRFGKDDGNNSDIHQPGTSSHYYTNLLHL
jgi:hypothetical protein